MVGSNNFTRESFYDWERTRGHQIVMLRLSPDKNATVTIRIVFSIAHRVIK